VLTCHKTLINQPLPMLRSMRTVTAQYESGSRRATWNSSFDRKHGPAIHISCCRVSHSVYCFYGYSRVAVRVVFLSSLQTNHVGFCKSLKTLRSAVSRLSNVDVQ